MLSKTHEEVAGVDKFFSRHSTFRGRYFTCASDRVWKKWMVKTKDVTLEGQLSLFSPFV